VRSAVLLSPLSELDVHFGRLSLGAPPHIPVCLADSFPAIFLTAAFFTAQLSVVTKPVPTGPRAGLHPKPTPVPRKRRRVETGEDSSSSAGEHPHLPLPLFGLLIFWSTADLPYARLSRPVPHPSSGSTPVRPATAVSEDQLHRRLAAVQAEMRRLASAQKELYWQLQALRQSEPVNPSSRPQVCLLPCFYFNFSDSSF
jgi:hypothetical protein